MRNIITIFALLFSVSTTSSFAQNVQSYTDPRGTVWNRWIEKEKTKTGYLLLVVENPVDRMNDDSVSQVPVYKKYYSESKIENFNADVEYYTSLKDVAKRPSSYYEKHERSTSAPGQVLWTPVREWTAQDEADYAIWFRQNVSAGFAIGQGIKFDCADFGVFARWIYAHDRRLPVANTLTGSGKLFGHWSGSAAWDRLPTDPDWKKDLRFKEAVKYLMMSIYTHSIIKDLYPVEITPKYVTAGTILLNLYGVDSGHTQVINKIGAECNGRDCMTVLYGNEPSAEHAYADIAWIQNVKKDRGGFLRWRWPIKSGSKWQLKAKADMPGYSMEQFNHQSLNSQDFAKLIFQKLGLSVSPLSKALDALDNMVTLLEQRIMITIAGHFYCHVQICNQNSELYDNYSTPSRDLRFRESQMAFYANLTNVPQQDMHWVESALQDLSDSSVLGTHMSYADYIENKNNIWSNMSSDPTKSIHERWGIQQGPKFDKYFMLTYAWAVVMAVNRTMLVYDAQATCIDMTCTPQDVQRLRTDRLDQSIRSVRQALRKDFSLLTPNEQSYVTLTLGTMQVHDYTAAAFLLDNNNWVDNMSSNPMDERDRRWGVR